METIYDFNPNRREIIEYGLGNKERYLKIIDYDDANLDIACMLHDRNDIRWEVYAERLPVGMKQDFYRTIYHP